MSNQQSVPLLLQLPDACLVEILRCLVRRRRSWANAACAHSRLRRAAVQARSSIIRRNLTQQQVDSLQLYLSAHRQHVSKVTLEGAGDTVTLLRQLPLPSSLSCLDLQALSLQLQPGHGFQGVLPAGTDVQQLVLGDCLLLDGQRGLAAALLALPGLQHLDLIASSDRPDCRLELPAGMLGGLRQLTYLGCAGMTLQHAAAAGGAAAPAPVAAATGLATQPGVSPSLSGLQHLTRLQVLRLVGLGPHRVSAELMPGCSGLTELMLVAPDQQSLIAAGEVYLDPAGLAGRTQLRALSCRVADRPAGLAQLLSQLQHMQQLTHLCAICSLSGPLPLPPPPQASAFSALTASSALQHLQVHVPQPPPGAWQHLLPAGRQLPHLQVLILQCCLDSNAAAPDSARLVSCCPALTELRLGGLQCRPELLQHLRGLPSLHTLQLILSRASGPPPPAALIVDDEWRGVVELTGLRHLDLELPPAQGRLLSLTKLRGLTHLYYNDQDTRVTLCEAPGDQPVWRQLLRVVGRASTEGSHADYLRALIINHFTNQ